MLRMIPRQTPSLGVFGLFKDFIRITFFSFDTPFQVKVFFNLTRALFFLAFKAKSVG
jgi:hypothetical protein